jgi:hypothetical protein
VNLIGGLKLLKKEGIVIDFKKFKKWGG